MPDVSSNGRPLSSHDRHLDSDFARSSHIEHVAIDNALCMTCGCCWCCDHDCCAEYVCPNPDCGCSDIAARQAEARYATSLGGPDA